MQARPGRRFVLPRRFLDTENDESKGEECRNDRDPEYGGEAVGGQHHEADRRQRSYESTDRIE